jgi:hypothetical protein
MGSWFSLPRLGTSSFATLMKLGVSYDRSLGFKMDSATTDVDGALKIIGTALGEEVELNLRCLVCGREACLDCPYAGFCDRAGVSSLCLCGDHARGDGAFEAYKGRFAETLPVS